MDAFWGWHGTLGLSVVVVNALVGLLLIKARKERAPVPAVLKAVAYLGQALLLVQVLIGLDLWGHGARPSSSGVWSWLHMLLPIGALLFTVMLLVTCASSPFGNMLPLFRKAPGTLPRSPSSLTSSAFSLDRRAVISR